MSNTLIVGALRALLEADTSEFTAKMSAASKDVQGLAASLQRDLEPRQRAVNAAVRDFLGGQEIRKAEEYAQAVEKIGGTSRLTAADQQKVNKAVEEALSHYRALGVEAPAHLQKLSTETKQTATSTGLLDQQWAKLTTAFAGGMLMDRAVDGLLSFGKAVIDDAGKVADLADKTGLSTTAVQIYGQVVKEAGGTVDGMANAVFKLGINIEKGGTEITKALGDIKLSYEQVRNLKPEEQFELIAERLHGVERVQERNRIGVALFGKTWAEVAPAVEAGIRSIADATTVMSESQIRAIDAASDAWDRFVANRKANLGQFVGELTKASDAVDTWFESTKRKFVLMGAGFLDSGFAGLKGGSDAANIMNGRGAQKSPLVDAEAINEISQLNRVLETAAQRMAKARAELVKLTDAQKDEIRSAIDLGDKVDDVAEKYNLSADAAKILTKYLAEQTRGIAEAAQATKKLAEEKKKADQAAMNSALKDAFNFQAEVKTIHNAEEAIRKLIGTVKTANLGKDVAGSLVAPGVKFTGLDFAGDQSIADFGLNGFFDQIQTASKEASAEVKHDWQQTLSETAGAFETLANIAGDDFGGIAKVVGEVVGAMQLGGQAGSQMDKGWDQLTGTNRNLASGFANVAAGALSAAAAIDQATGSGSTAERVLGGAAAGASAGAMFGPWGAGVGAGVGAGIGWIQSMRDGRNMIKEFAKAFDSTVTDTLSGFDELHNKLGELGDEGEQLWKNLMDVRPGDEDGAERAIRAIQEALSDAADEARRTEEALDDIGESGKDWQELEEIAKRFGVDLTMMGAAFEQAKVNTIAKDYLDAFTALTAAGADTTAVLQGMSDEINDWLALAITSGRQIPEAMRPILEAMVEAGLLTDAAGNKIEDLSSLNFAPTLEQGIHNMTTATWALVEVLGGTVPDAFRDMASEARRTMDGIGSDVSDLANHIHRELGGVELGIDMNAAAADMNGVDLPGYADGTHGQYVDFGAGTPVMLHGMEKVVPMGQDSGGGRKVVKLTPRGPRRSGSGTVVNVYVGQRQVTDIVTDAVNTSSGQGRIAIGQRNVQREVAFG